MVKSLTGKYGLGNRVELDQILREARSNQDMQCLSLDDL